MVEVGYRDGLRYTVNLQEEPARDGRPGLALGPGSVVVVTGAAGGITSAIVADLAAASRGQRSTCSIWPRCPSGTTSRCGCSGRAATR